VVFAGQAVNYTITLSNEGTIPATAITVVDRIPGGMILDDPAWTAGTGNTATRVVPGPLAPGASIAIAMRVRVTSNSIATFVNRAEIRDARDDGGNPTRDIDSVPNDDVDGQDDIGNVQVTQPISIPVDAPWALLLLTLAMLSIGTLALRRRI
jgi:uncharacterized repeat protein (TIGR01451 family)